MDSRHKSQSHGGGCAICNAGPDAAGAKAKNPISPTRRRFLREAIKTPALAGAALASPALLAACDSDNSARRESSRFASGEFVVRAGWALTYDGGNAREGDLRLVRGADILVRNGFIEDVSSSPIRGFEVLDASDQLVLPGFISGHTHVAGGSSTRGIIENGRSFARPLELAENLYDDELDALTAFNLAELLLSGCTTQVEQSLSLRQAQSYVRVARRWGVRGYPAGMVPGIGRLFPIWFRGNDQTLFDSVPDTLAEIDANLTFARSVNGIENGRILPMLAPHATDTQTPETLRAIAAGAAELGNGIHIHLSQSMGETETVKRLWGVTPTQWIEQYGFFDGPLFAAHMSGIDLDVDPDIMNANGGVYAHCPSAGGAGGGTQPYPETLAKGMNVNIGIDTHSNDYVENLKLAVLYGQARYSLLAGSGTDMRSPTMWDAVRGATLTAAEGLGREDLGRIQPGAKADLTGIKVDGPLIGTGALPPEPLNNLLYAHGLAVRTVMTDGYLQVLEGSFVADDFAAVASEGGAVTRKLWGQLEAEGFFD
ncbi:amidohydrolase family protein [Algiphilus sp.]|uniref:amidohydrolase family protein n=1 Tax=Algiphilus sp. TaxID=1872431 RepID=UPI0032F027B3